MDRNAPPPPQWPYLDIGWLDSNGTHSWDLKSTIKGIPKFQKLVYRTSDLFPPVRRPYGTLVLYAPRDAEAFLTGRFGPRWRSTCVVANWDHRHETVREPALGHGDTCTLLSCSALPWLPMIREEHSGAEVLSADGRVLQRARFNQSSLAVMSICAQ